MHFNTYDVFYSQLFSFKKSNQTGKLHTARKINYFLKLQ